MKELTAAQGKLRCGECASVFNAMETLSTKLPGLDDSNEQMPFDSLNKKSKREQYQRDPSSTKTNSVKAKQTTSNNFSSKRWLPLALILLLSGILATQAWLTQDLWFGGGRAPDKIKTISRKVFTHPSEPDALIITASIRNDADAAQPFPYLETQLLDANNKVIALRRFKPQEYYEQYTQGSLLKSNETISIRLKIQDPPGNRAKRFEFNYL
jgi:hypothetical protein